MLTFLSENCRAGEVTEWLKVHAWNACVREYREFESHPLRQFFYKPETLKRFRLSAFRSSRLTPLG